MKNVWKGMLVGALVGAGLDAATTLGRGSRDIADAAAHKVREANLPDMARNALDDAKVVVTDIAHTEGAGRLRDAAIHGADVVRRRAGEV